MTELGTGMRTVGSPFPSTDLSTRMGVNISFILRLFELTTETVVLGHDFIKLELTLGTAPSVKDLVFVFIFVDVEDPGLDTFQVH